MFCGKCGTQNDDGAKFCCGCGAPLEAASPVENSYTDPAADPLAAAEAKYTQPDANTSSQDSYSFGQSSYSDGAAAFGAAASGAAAAAGAAGAAAGGAAGYTAERAYQAMPEDDPKAAKKAQKAADKAQAKADKKARKQAQKEARKSMDFNAPDGLNYKPIGMWGYLGWEILFSIPIIGLILMIVFSVGASKNVNLRNFAKSHLVYLIICIIIAIVIVIILAATGAFGGHIISSGTAVAREVGSPSVKLN